MLSPCFIGYAKHSTTPQLLSMAANARQRLCRRMKPEARQRLREIIDYLDNLLLQRIEETAGANAMRHAIAEQLELGQLRIAFQ